MFLLSISMPRTLCFEFFKKGSKNFNLTSIHCRKIRTAVHGNYTLKEFLFFKSNLLLLEKVSGNPQIQIFLCILFPWNIFPTHRTFHIVRIPSVTLQILKNMLCRNLPLSMGLQKLIFFCVQLVKK